MEKHYGNCPDREKIEVGDIAVFDSLAGPVKVVISGDTPIKSPFAPKGRVRVVVTERRHYLYLQGHVIDCSPTWLSLLKRPQPRANA